MTEISRLLKEPQPHLDPGALRALQHSVRCSHQGKQLIPVSKAEAGVGRKLMIPV